MIQTMMSKPLVSIVLMLILDIVSGQAGSDSCNYGQRQGLMYTEGVCNQNMDREFGHIETYMVLCGYSDNEPIAYDLEWNNSDCSGKPSVNETLETFYCCQDCIDNCTSFQLTTYLFGNTSIGSESHVCNFSEITGGWHYTFYTQFENECFDFDNHTNSINTTFFDDSMFIDYYISDSECGNQTTPFEYSFDAGCHYMEAYSSPVYNYINGYDAWSDTYDTKGIFSEYTSEPTYYYECDLEEDGLIISWEDLFSDSDNILSDVTSIHTMEGTNDDTGVFEVTVTVETKYIVGATYDAFTSYYEDYTNNGYLGVTFVLDTNEFSNEGRLLENANTCENRVSSSFTDVTSGMDFLRDFWNYTLYPSNPNYLGNDDYGLEYGDQNIWDLELINASTIELEDCGNIKWSKTFTFTDLWSICKDSDNNPSYDLIIDDDNNEIRLELDFYLTLVSPNPLYLRLCDDGATDCGQYLTTTLLSHPLSVVFTKQQSIVSNNDGIEIDLFTNTIISSIFVEDSEDNEYDSSYFKLTMITTVPNFMTLNVGTAVILSPTLSDLINSNNNNSSNLDIIDSMIILEDNGSYMTDDCLIETSFRCLQKFEIIILINECPSDTGVNFDGSYYFSADFNCRLDSYGNKSEAICNDYTSDEPLSVTLDSVDLQYTEACDSSLYDIDWSGSITFWNEYYNESASLFSFGETVNVRISLDNDISNYEIFELTIEQCYVCTANVNDSGNLNSITDDGCLDATFVDSSLFYIMPYDVDLDFELANSNNISNTIEDFTFTLPVLADNVFFVHCTVELAIDGNYIESEVRRILQNDDDDAINGNTFQTVIGYGYVDTINNEDDSSGGSITSGTSEDTFTGLYIAIIAIAVIIVVLLVITLFCLWKKKEMSMMKNVQASVDIIASGMQQEADDQSDFVRGT